jgi:hypothetical protein
MTAMAKWPELYAELIEEDIGASVTVHNWGSGEQSSERLLELLHNNPNLRRQISQADVITVWTGGYTIRKMITEESASCSYEEVEAYGRDIEEILSLIINLRGQKPTIIRLLEFFQPRINVLEKLGILDEKNQCLSDINQRLHQAAAKYDIPVAPVHHAFNGPEGRTDSGEAGYLENVRMFSHTGDELIAALLLELGYEHYIPDLCAFQNSMEFLTP